MLVIYIVLLIGVKYFGFVDTGWDTVAIISIALILVEVRLYQNSQATFSGLIRGANIIDGKLNDLDRRLSQKADKDFDY